MIARTRKPVQQEELSPEQYEEEFDELEELEELEDPEDDDEELDDESSSSSFDESRIFRKILQNMITLILQHKKI